MLCGEPGTIGLPYLQVLNQDGVAPTMRAHQTLNISVAVKIVVCSVRMLAITPCMISPSATRSHCPNSDLRQTLIVGRIHGALAMNHWDKAEIEI